MARLLQTDTNSSTARPLSISDVLQQPNTLQGKLESQDTGYLSGMGARTGSEQVAGANKIASSVKMGSEDLQKGVDTAKQGGVSNVLKGVAKGAQGLAEGAFGTISGVAQTAFAPVTAAISPVVKTELPAVGKILGLMNPTTKVIYDNLSPSIKESLAPKLQEVVDKYPNATALAGDIVNTLLLGLGGGETGGAIKESVGKALSKEGLQVSKEALINAPKTLKSAVSGSADAIATKQTANELQNIKDIVSPNLTAKESKLAQSQGRVYAGKESTLLKGETPAQVATSDANARQIFSIHENIPGAGTMDAPTLHEALGNKVTEITNELRPKLDATPLHPDAQTKLNTEWQKIQKEQMTNAPADQEANVLKRQKKFDAFLQKTKQGNPSDVIAEVRAGKITQKEAVSRIAEASKPPTLGDLWDTAIKYDNSISDAVKQARPNVPGVSESLLAQREEWIQNRAILKKAINDSATGLGSESEKAFQQMSDMLDAKANIVRNTPTIKSQTLKPSKFRQALESPTGKKVQAGLKLVGGTYVVDKALKATTGLGY